MFFELLDPRSFKDAFWLFLLLELPDNNARNMMVWVDENSKFHLSHIDFEHAGNFDRIKNFDVAFYPIMMSMPQSFTQFTLEDFNKINAWKSEFSGYSERIQIFQEKSQQWLKTSPNLREIAYEILGDAVLSHWAYELKSEGYILASLLRPNVTGYVDRFYFRDVLPRFRFIAAICNTTSQIINFAFGYWIKKEGNEETVVMEESRSLKHNQAYSLSFSKYHNDKSKVLRVQPIINGKDLEGVDFVNQGENGAYRVMISIFSSPFSAESFVVKRQDKDRFLTSLSIKSTNDMPESVIVDIGAKPQLPLPNERVEINLANARAQENKELSFLIYKASLSLLDAVDTEGSVDEETQKAIDVGNAPSGLFSIYF